MKMKQDRVMRLTITSTFTVGDKGRGVRRKGGVRKRRRKEKEGGVRKRRREEEEGGVRKRRRKGEEEGGEGVREELKNRS